MNKTACCFALIRTDYDKCYDVCEIIFCYYALLKKRKAEVCSALIENEWFV